MARPRTAHRKRWTFRCKLPVAPVATGIVEEDESATSDSGSDSGEDDGDDDHAGAVEKFLKQKQKKKKKKKCGMAARNRRR